MKEKPSNTSSYIIREATHKDAEGIAFVHVNSWKTSYRGLVDQDYLDAINYEDRLNLRKEILQITTLFHLVGVAGEQIVGFADVGPIRAESRVGLRVCEENIGEVYAIYLLEEYKGKGCGKALLDRCRQWLSENGFKSFVVRALAGNMRAKRFYEREGGRLIGENTIIIGDKPYHEVSYLFKTLNV
jgi:ribosomal protein S18 acetylase RimI-like enzyme